MPSNITPQSYIKKVVSKHAAHFGARVCGRHFDYQQQRIRQYYQYIEDIDEADHNRRDGLYKAADNDQTVYTHIGYNINQLLPGPITPSEKSTETINKDNTVKSMPRLPQTAVIPILPNSNIKPEIKEFMEFGRKIVQIIEKTPQMQSSIEGATTFRIVAYPRVKAINENFFSLDNSLDNADAKELYWAYTHFFRKLKVYQQDICNPISRGSEESSSFYCGQYTTERDLIRAIGAISPPSEGLATSDQMGIMGVCSRASFRNVQGTFIQRTRVNNKGDLLRSMADTGNTSQGTIVIDFLSDWFNRSQSAADNENSPNFKFWNEKGTLTDGPQTTTQAYEPLTAKYKDEGGTRVKQIWDNTQKEFDSKTTDWNRRTLFTQIIKASREVIQINGITDLSKSRRESQDTSKTFGPIQNPNDTTKTIQSTSSNNFQDVSETDPQTGQVFYRNNVYLDEVNSGTFKFQPEYEFSLQLRPPNTSGGKPNRTISDLNDIINWWFDATLDPSGTTNLPKFDIPQLKKDARKFDDSKPNEIVIEYPQNVVIKPIPEDELDLGTIPGYDIFLVTTNSPKLIRDTTSVFIDTGAANNSGRVAKIRKMSPGDTEAKYANVDRGAGIYSKIINPITPDGKGIPNEFKTEDLESEINLNNQFDTIANKDKVLKQLEGTAQFTGAVDTELYRVLNTKLSRPVFLRHYTHTQVNIPPTFEGRQRLDMMCSLSNKMCCMLTFWDGFRTHLDFSRLIDELFSIINEEILEIVADETGNVASIRALISRILEDELATRGQTARFSILKNQEQTPGSRFFGQVGSGLSSFKGFDSQVQQTLSKQIFDIQANLLTPTTFKMREDLINTCNVDNEKSRVDKESNQNLSAVDICDIGYPIGGFAINSKIITKPIGSDVDGIGGIGDKGEVHPDTSILSSIVPPVPTSNNTSKDTSSIPTTSTSKDSITGTQDASNELKQIKADNPELVGPPIPPKLIGTGVPLLTEQPFIGPPLPVENAPVQVSIPKSVVITPPQLIEGTPTVILDIEKEKQILEMASNETKKTVKQVSGADKIANNVSENTPNINKGVKIASDIQSALSKARGISNKLVRHLRNNDSLFIDLPPIESKSSFILSVVQAFTNIEADSVKINSLGYPTVPMVALFTYIILYRNTDDAININNELSDKQLSEKLRIRSGVTTRNLLDILLINSNSGDVAVTISPAGSTITKEMIDSRPNKSIKLNGTERTSFVTISIDNWGP